ncbi:MAG: hypothetical protein SFT92_04150 [Rickettsiales bacterium]|nr:hypothetical protein [Rickettsiales bacterium]
MADVPNTADTTPDAPKKQSLGARLLVATAFSTIGAKIGFIGTAMDVNDLFKNTEMTVGQKIRASFNGQLTEKLMEKIKDIMRIENKGAVSAIAKASKYTIITTVAGTALGAVMGWVRGGRIEHWKDIFIHPWESTKIIVGLQEPHTAKAVEKPVPVVPVEEYHPDNKWQQRVAAEHPHKHKQHASHVEAVSQERGSEASISL